MDSIDFNSLAFFNEARSAGEAIIAKFIFKMAFYADIKREGLNTAAAFSGARMVFVHMVR